jgi:hypothetical protein
MAGPSEAAAEKFLVAAGAGGAIASVPLSLESVDETGTAARLAAGAGGGTCRGAKHTALRLETLDVLIGEVSFVAVKPAFAYRAPFVGASLKSFW